MGQITERQPRQVQIASSIPPTTGPNKSNVQSSTRSNMRVLLETEPNKIRDRTHTPAGGIDEELDMARLVLRYSRTLRSRRNRVAPISVLPPELLARIFRFYALEECNTLARECVFMSDKVR